MSSKTTTHGDYTIGKRFRQLVALHWWRLQCASPFISRSNFGFIQDFQKNLPDLNMHLKIVSFLALIALATSFLTINEENLNFEKLRALQTCAKLEKTSKISNECFDHAQYPRRSRRSKNSTFLKSELEAMCSIPCQKARLFTTPKVQKSIILDKVLRLYSRNRL